jgi:translation initiation factor 1 (eIF-1/SUI1)
MMDHQKKFKSLEDLAELSDQKQVLKLHNQHQHDGKGKSIRVVLDIHGRKGKSVTVVIGLHHNPATM